MPNIGQIFYDLFNQRYADMPLQHPFPRMPAKMNHLEQPHFLRVFNFLALHFAVQGGRTPLVLVHNALAKTAAPRLLQNAAVLYFLGKAVEKRCRRLPVPALNAYDHKYSLYLI